MIIINQLPKEIPVECEYVKCPICKKGRLCDRAKTTNHIRVISSCTVIDPLMSGIILKCPACAQKFSINISS